MYAFRCCHRFNYSASLLNFIKRCGDTMASERKQRNLKLRMTEKQFDYLHRKTAEYGFSSVCEYIRFQLFLTKPIADKINKIYHKICEHNE